MNTGDITQNRAWPILSTHKYQLLSLTVALDKVGFLDSCFLPQVQAKCPLNRQPCVYREGDNPLCLDDRCTGSKLNEKAPRLLQGESLCPEKCVSLVSLPPDPSGWGLYDLQMMPLSFSHSKFERELGSHFLLPITTPVTQPLYPSLQKAELICILHLSAFGSHRGEAIPHKGKIAKRKWMAGVIGLTLYPPSLGLSFLVHQVLDEILSKIPPKSKKKYFKI